MKRVAILLVLTLAIGFALQMPAAAETPVPAKSSPNAAARIILVLDASGSMWGQIEGKSKIAIAKEVLADLIKELPDQSRVGLVAYGHRSKADCNDVEDLVPLMPLDKKALIAKIEVISPKGKTPITLSIRQTAEKLQRVEEETVIILVSDGKETCEGDPCALVKELKAAGIRFAMYVIGFDVTEEEKEQLACMAEAGGGQYYTAKSAQEFRLAAKEAVNVAQTFGYFKVEALRNQKTISARLDIYPQGESKAVLSARTITDAGRPGTRLKPGVYDLSITDDTQKPAQMLKIADVAVTAGATVERRVDFSGGTLSVAVSANGQKETASLYIYPAGAQQPLATGDTSRDNPKSFVLAPGVYDLLVAYRKSQPSTERRFEGIQIGAGQTIEKVVAFGEGKLSIEVLVNGRKGSAGLAVYEAGTNKRVTTGDTSRDNPKSFTLNPGVYDLVVVYRESKPETEQRFEGVEIRAGESATRQAVFGEGELSIEVLVNAGKGAAGLYIFEAGTEKRIATSDTSRDNPKRFKLNAGYYDLQVVYRKAIPETETLLKNIQIVQAQTVEKRVDFQEGFLDVKVSSGGQATRGGLSFYRPGEAKRLATGNTGKPIPMQPGRYEVVVKAYQLKDNPEKRMDFDIEVGKTTILNADF